MLVTLVTSMIRQEHRSIPTCPVSSVFMSQLGILLTICLHDPPASSNQVGSSALTTARIRLGEFDVHILIVHPLTFAGSSVASTPPFAGWSIVSTPLHHLPQSPPSPPTCAQHPYLPWPVHRNTPTSNGHPITSSQITHPSAHITTCIW